jgi:hypothetical protein
MASQDRRGVIGREDAFVSAEPAFVELQVAPFRRGFLVRRGDREQLLSALFGAATIWGGTRCPVLPVESDGTVGADWLQVAAAIDPAALVDFTSSGSGASAWSDAGTSRWPVVPAQPLEDRAFWNPHPIAAIDPEELGNLSLFLPKGRSLLDAASAGCVELPDDVAWWRQVTYGVLEVDSPRQLASAQLGGHTVLSAAMLNDDDSNAGLVWVSMMLLWLTSDPDDPDEIVRWWNTRALRPRIWRQGVSILSTPEAVLDERFADDLRSTAQHHVFTRPDLVVASHNIPEDRLHDIAARLGFEHDQTGLVREGLPMDGPPDPDRKLTYMIRNDLLGWWGADRTSGASSVAAISVQRPSTRIREPSPMAWNPGLYGTGHVSLRVSGQPITGPQLPSVARRYHKHARWHRGRLEMPQTIAPIYDFEIQIPDADEILKAACSARNVTYTPSDKARHIHGVWALARDPEMFRRPAIIDVIKILTPESSRDLIRHLKNSPNLTGPEKQELKTLAAANRVTMRTLGGIASHSLADARSRKEVAAALQELVTASMVVHGLRADCPVCALQHLFRLDEAHPVPHCPGCGAEAAYNVDDNTGEPVLYYRLNTLVQVLSHNGGLAPLAATALLASEGANLVPGAQIFRDRTEAGEVDLLGWQGETLFAGEAKMSANQIAASDHDKDVSKSVLVGADTHFAVCLELIPAEAQDALQSACDRAGINLVVLDSSKLFIAEQSFSRFSAQDTADHTGRCCNSGWV